MKQIILYQKNNNRKIKVWTIAVEKNSSNVTIISTSGQQGGKMTKTDTVISVGKGNKTSYEQACSEAKSKIASKIRAGYVKDVSTVKDSTTLGSGIPQPMLAQKFDPTGKQNNSKTLEQLGIKGKEIFIQKKFDGNRCLTHLTLNSATQYTRKGDEFQPIAHIQTQLIECFNKIYKYVNGKYGVTEYWIDGELMTKSFSFNTLNGLLKKQTKTAEDWKMLEEVDYHIYDVILPVPYSTRKSVVEYFKHKNLKPTETETIIASDALLESKLQEYIESGEEGLMIRIPDQVYQNKRSWGLLKYKVFQDDEYEVIDFEESVKGGMAGNVVCKVNKKTTDRDGKEIKTFKCGLNFTHNELKEIWNNKSKYIGSMITIKYFKNSEYGIPRFGRGYKFY